MDRTTRNGVELECTRMTDNTDVLGAMPGEHVQTQAHEIGICSRKRKVQCSKTYVIEMFPGVELPVDSIRASLSVGLSHPRLARKVVVSISELPKYTYSIAVHRATITM